MQLKMFSIYDSKAETYLPPAFMKTRGEYLRAVIDTIKSGQSQLANHPADFTLFELGAWDTSTSRFELYEAKINLGTALEFSNAT